MGMGSTLAPVSDPVAGGCNYVDSGNDVSRKFVLLRPDLTQVFVPAQHSLAVVRTTIERQLLKNGTQSLREPHVHGLQQSDQVSPTPEGYVSVARPPCATATAWRPEDPFALKPYSPDPPL